MQKLIHGLRRFMNTVQRDERELFERLAGAQHPEAMFIACSDSRVVPHLLTQTRPGDLFILRNAGHIVPPYGDRACGAAASVEFAVSALGVRDIVVCGHSDCGAVKSLLDPDSCAHMPAVRRWLDVAAPVREIMARRAGELAGGGDPAARINAAIEANVLAQLANLHTHPCVAERISAGALEIHGWVYDIGSGGVRAFDSQAGVFVELIEVERGSGRGRAGSPDVVA